jgi:hypothetical protein
VRRRSRFSTSSPFLGHGGLSNTEWSGQRHRVVSCLRGPHEMCTRRCTAASAFDARLLLCGQKSRGGRHERNTESDENVRGRP